MKLTRVKGMRDFIGKDALFRKFIIDNFEKVFRIYGYDPLESPALEMWETLSAKGGEEIEAETFKFKDKGNRDVGLRFDLTVPLARIVATNPVIPKPFKRYAIGKVWRYDQPQAGRYREFTQADVDIIGVKDMIADAEVISVAIDALKPIIGEHFKIRLNNRKVLKGMIELAGISESLSFECFRAIDKLDKIGIKGVKKELNQRGITGEQVDALMEFLDLRGAPEKILPQVEELMQKSWIGSDGVMELAHLLDYLDFMGNLQFIELDLSLARGLDYYTGPIFEVAYTKYEGIGSIGAGGRYDNLIKKLGGVPTSATGISLGVDRIIDILIKTKQVPEDLGGIDIYVVAIGNEVHEHALKITQKLRSLGLITEYELMGRNLRKALKYADMRGAKFMIAIGQKDIENNTVSIRDMNKKSQFTVPISELYREIIELLKA